jgi:pilus assembly protein TadC
MLLGGAVLMWPGKAAAHRFAWLAGTEVSARPVWRPPRTALHAVSALAAGLSVLLLVGGVAGFGLGAVVAAGAWWLLRRTSRPRAPDGVADRLRLAGTLDLLAACLRAGLPVPAALSAVAEIAPEEIGTALRSAAGLLALGAAPGEAWAPVRAWPELTELAAAAIRTSEAGTAFAAAAGELAERLRDGLAIEAEERAERAGVLLALPVGLCFLPAFFCLGVLPVVFGLAARLAPAL